MMNSKSRLVFWILIYNNLSFPFATSRSDSKMLLLVHESLNCLEPDYMSDMLSIYQPNSFLRSLDRCLLQIPRPHSKSSDRDQCLCTQSTEQPARLFEPCKNTIFTQLPFYISFYWELSLSVYLFGHFSLFFWHLWKPFALLLYMIAFVKLTPTCAQTYSKLLWPLTG